MAHGHFPRLPLAPVTSRSIIVSPMKRDRIAVPGQLVQFQQQVHALRPTKILLAGPFEGQRVQFAAVKTECLVTSASTATVCESDAYGINDEVEEEVVHRRFRARQRSRYFEGAGQGKTERLLCRHEIQAFVNRFDHPRKLVVVDHGNCVAQSNCWDDVYPGLASAVFRDERHRGG